jgi:hypothetical protein
MARSVIGLLLLLLLMGCGAPSIGARSPATALAVTTRSSDDDLKKIREARGKIEEELLFNLFFHVMYQREMLVNKTRNADSTAATAYREVIAELDDQAQDILKSLRIPERMPD